VTDTEQHLRQAVIDTALAMNAQGINQGKSGNVSVRLASAEGEPRFLITPTAIAYDRLRAQDIVAMHGMTPTQPAPRPSSEWRFHLDIYRARPEVAAVVHTHAAFATSLACLARGIPAFHYMVAMAGGNDIRCAPYATFGTQTLSDYALAALAGRQACLLAQHGMIAVGRSLSAALALAVEVEALARMYWQALQIGEPKILPDEEMARVLEKMADYRG
jgi:L-fuculose-phosphate aldolase